ncbi:hypothetical protein TNCV_2500281 [Trichonephila clavipes]|nr:hypothetical protein TNCV_2500281 [Trichonephila clavipes]
MNNSVREGDAPPFSETSFNLCRGWIFQLHSACVEVGTNNKITCVEVFLQRTIDKYSACVEVGKPIDENPACVEVGTNSV